ncbi:phage antirepressor KilAC domain-containing protein [Brevibacterium oceani]|uniref:phage antirepressor KilAC domain-containing protein n=1 Tax=Brevibacterium oceani TaxID=358099 RepID=UPI0015E7436C|nr:phage antirepressor KilAC domain-containing protein [Brevibacterium oceani]
MTNDISTLVPIRDHDGQQVASGRDMHAYLGVSSNYTTWFDRMVGYGFVEGQDYVSISGTVPTGRTDRTYTQIDHAVTVDMAKELGMIQRTPEGKRIRQYFIEVEKQAREAQAVAAPSGPELVARALIEAQSMLEAKDEKIATLEPKARAWDHIVSSEASWSFNDAAKFLFEHKQIVVGEKRLFNRCVAWGYLYRDHKRRPHVYQRYLEQGLFAVKARTYRDHETGEVFESSAPQVRITGKGLDTIYRRLTDGQLEVSA